MPERVLVVYFGALPGRPVRVTVLFPDFHLWVVEILPGTPARLIRRVFVFLGLSPPNRARKAALAREEMREVDSCQILPGTGAAKPLKSARFWLSLR
jgi:hypothetical protein